MEERLEERVSDDSGESGCGGRTERSEEPFADGGSRRVRDVEKGRR